MRARSKFGMAMAAIISTIATTINSSINEKPLCFAIGVHFPSERLIEQNSVLPGPDTQIKLHLIGQLGPDPSVRYRSYHVSFQRLKANF